MFEILSVCKGGGYRYCRTSPPHPKRNDKGLYPLHRVLVENEIGRILERWEMVHHKNHDKTDDRIENLELVVVDEHNKIHARGRELVSLTCSHCGKPFERLAKQVKPKIKAGQTTFFCGRSCMGKQHNIDRRKNHVQL